jgi:hypothetical protein
MTRDSELKLLERENEKMKENLGFILKGVMDMCKISL